MVSDDSPAQTEQHDSIDDPRDQLGEWLSTRPAWGALLLGLGSAVLSWQAVVFLDGAPLGSLTPVGIAGLTAPLFCVFLAMFALGRPDYSTPAGFIGIGLTLFDVVGMLIAPGTVRYPKFVFTALLAAGVGGLLCASWHSGGPRIKFGRFDSTFRMGRGVLVVGLMVLLVLNGVPAVSGDRVPAQEGRQALGGLVLQQGTLDAGSYSYQAECPKPDDAAILTLPLFADRDEPCLDITVESSTTDSEDFPNKLARQQLDSARSAPVEINDFVIYKNFYNPNKDQFEHVELSADFAKAETEEKTWPAAVDVYISEYRAEEADARVDLVNIPLIEDPGIKVDSVNYWTCTPGNESGFGTINDVRLIADAQPRLTGGKDATLLAHQLGSTKTTLTNFAVDVRLGRREAPEADTGPTDTPSECVTP